MEVCTYCYRNTASHHPKCRDAPRDAVSPRYTISADVIGHLQRMEDLPEIGSRVNAVWSGLDVNGEVFAHIPHPDPMQSGWGFALIKFN